MTYSPATSGVNVKVPTATPAEVSSTVAPIEATAALYVVVAASPATRPVAENIGVAVDPTGLVVTVAVTVPAVKSPLLPPVI